MSNQVVAGKLAPTPDDFVKFVPYVCTQMQAPFYIEVRQVTIEEWVNKDAKGRTKSRRAIDLATEASTIAPPERQMDSSSSPFASVASGPGVVLTAVCEPTGRLVELRFQRCDQIPVLLLRVIALCLPYHQSLARLTVRWGPPQSRLLSELAALLPLSNITELCLDDSPVLERDCHSLLERPSPLRSLSLARCDLDDTDCVQLAGCLKHPEPASRTLAALSLASNAVTDAGAAALADALRTNRALRHLNLAGNRIADDGAAAILSSLARFRLRSDEVADKRRRLLDHLKRKEIMYNKCFNELMSASGGKTSPDKSTPNSKKKPPTRPQGGLAPTASSAALRAQAMAGELLGPLLEPFDAEHTLQRADGLYCVGNLTLSHLNLAYNNLQLASLTLLLHTLQSQAEEGRAHSAGAAGLLRVQLDGNLLPVACIELEMVNELLTHALGPNDQKQANKRPDRLKKKN